VISKSVFCPVFNRERK